MTGWMPFALRGVDVRGLALSGAPAWSQAYDPPRMQPSDCAGSGKLPEGATCRTAFVMGAPAPLVEPVAQHHLTSDPTSDPAADVENLFHVPLAVVRIQLEQIA